MMSCKSSCLDHIWVYDHRGAQLMAIASFLVDDPCNKTTLFLPTTHERPTIFRAAV